jgi:hypothetical protein
MASVAGDERDWVQIVLHETCRECGLRGADFAGAELAAPIAIEVDLWDEVLAVEPARLRRRPADDVWSALEYACHVRDTLALFAQRIERVLTEDEPQLGWWDHEAAAVDERYNEEDPAEVATALRLAAGQLVAALDPTHVGDRWARAGIRRSWERFTITDLGRFSLHETRHHRLDADRSAA